MWVRITPLRHTLDRMNSHLRTPFPQLIVGFILALVIGVYFSVVVLRDTLSNQTHKEVNVPSEVVTGWAKTFPHAPTLAVALTTEHFRDGRSPEVWVEDMRGIWSQLRFRYRTGKVQSGWTEGETALVIFKATSSSIWGERDRYEEYRLIKNSQGQWLIDQFRLVNDQIL